MGSKIPIEIFYGKKEDDDDDPIDMLRSPKAGTTAAAKQTLRSSHSSSAIKDRKPKERDTKLKRLRTTSLLEESFEQPAKKIKVQRVCYLCR